MKLNRICWRTAYCTTMPVGLLCAANLAVAQADSDSASVAGPDVALQEVVVTAQKRSERLSDVPVTVAALSGNQLASAGVSNITQLNVVVPGLQVQNSVGFAITHLRGIGSTAIGPGVENPIAVYVDGVYYASTQSSLFDFNDVQNVEVLKGPQGTLFGRNATGGLIQITTLNPTQARVVKADVSYGNYQTAKADLYVGGGLTDTLAADISAQISGAGQGWGTNLANGREVYRSDLNLGTRSKWVWTPIDTTKITLALDYARQHNSNIPFRQPPGGGNLPAAAPYLPSTYGSQWDASNDVQPLYINENGGASLRIATDLGHADLVNIAAYRRAATTLNFDLDDSAAPIQGAYLHSDENQFSEELQLLAKPGSTIQWTTGVYYFHSQSQYDPSRVTFGQLAFYPAPPSVYPFGALAVYGFQTAESIAGYGQATMPILSRTNLTLGLRYTHEVHSLAGSLPFFLPDGSLIPGTDTPFPEVSKAFQGVTYRAALDHHLTKDAMVYGSVSTGFKSGGYNTQAYADGPFKPEKLTAYEIGSKTEWFSHRLEANLAAFFYNYNDIQVERVEGAATGIINGAAATSRGADLDLAMKVTSGLTITGSAEYLLATFKSFPNAPLSNPDVGATTPLTVGSAAGNDLPYASRWVFTARGDYAFPFAGGNGDLNVVVNHVGSYAVEPDNVVKQPAYTKLNSSFDWYTASGRYGVSLWGRNLTNVASISGNITSVRGVRQGQFEAPRTYGITFNYRLQ